MTGQYALTNTNALRVMGHTPGQNVTWQTKALSNAPPPSNRGPTSLEHASRMPATSPINVQVLEQFLSGYDDTETKYLLEGFRYGFSLNYGGDQIGGVFKNHPSVLHNEFYIIVSNKLMQELQLGRIAGPFDDPPFQDFRVSDSLMPCRQ